MTEIILITLTNPFQKFKIKDKLPHAVLYVGTSLDNAGFNVKIIDERFDDVEKELNIHLKEDTLFVGISCMTGMQIMYGLRVAKTVREIIRQNKLKTKIVWGGIHPTLTSEQTLNNEYVDIIVRGEGEETAVFLAKALKENKGLLGLEGISYKENNKQYHNPDRRFINLNNLPDEDYSLVNIDNYIIKHFGVKVINFMTSRGCPHGCGFCYADVFHKRIWRGYDIKNIKRRMNKLIDKCGITGFLFDDDEFFIDKKRARDLMKYFKSKNINWSSRGIRVDDILNVDKEFLRLIEESGCSDLSIGVESGSNRILNLIGKKICVDDVIKCNLILKEYNIIPRYNFMIGFPTETIDEIKQTISLVSILMKDNPKAAISNIACFTPYPGCKLFNLLVSSGWNSPDNLEKWSNFNYEKNNFITDKKMSKIIRMIVFTSKFLNKVFEIKPRFIINLTSNIYKPFARFRFYNLFYYFPIEIKLANKFLKEGR